MTRNVEKFMAAHDPWSRMYSSVFHHNKTRILSKRLGVPMYYAAGAFLALVGYANCHARDGDLDGWDDRDIEKAIGWEGEPGTLAEGMVAAGFLDVTPNGYRIHNRSLYAQSWINASKQQKKRDKNKAESANRVPGTVPPHVPKSSYSLVQHVNGASFAASASDAAARGNQCGFEDMRVPTDSEAYDALQRDADAVDASFFQTQKHSSAPKERVARKGLSARHDVGASANDAALAPRQHGQPPVMSTPQHTGAPGVTTPCAEIVERNAMSRAAIDDAMRTRWGRIVRMNSTTRRELTKHMKEHGSVTPEMLDEAYTDAYGWHADNGSEVHGTTLVRILGDHARARQADVDQSTNVTGAAHGASLRSQQRAPRLSRKEEEWQRTLQQAELQHIENQQIKERSKREYDARMKKMIEEFTREREQ